MLFIQNDSGYTYGYCPLEKMKEYGVKPTSLVGPHRLKPEEDEKIAEMIDYLDHVQTPDIDPNVILYGPPEQGKHIILCCMRMLS